MTHKHLHKEKTVRLTIDFPAVQHTYIKMLAAKEGVSLRQYVIEHLPSLKKKKHTMIGKDEFDNLLRDMLVEHEDLLRRLSKK